MTFKLACADFAFPLLAHEQSLKLIAMLGFEGVDIGLFEGRSHLWPSREFENVARAAATLKARTAALGLRVADVFLQTAPDFRPYAINQPDAWRRALAREWFSRTLEYAAGCDCRHVTILPGVHFEEESRESSFQRAVDELTWRVAEARRAGITLGTEAHVGSLVDDPPSAAKLVAAVSGLTLTLDYTHFTRAGMADHAVEPLIAHASHFHVRGARIGRLQAPSRTTSSTIVESLSECDTSATAAGWESNTSGLTGNTATSATICPRRFCSATFCSQR